MSRSVQYKYADSSQVRQTANGRYQYTGTGRFAPTKNGQPLAPGYRKDTRGRVYDVARRREVARSNFGLGPAPAPRPKAKGSKVREAGLYLLSAPNIYATYDPSKLSPEAKLAVSIIAPRFTPGTTIFTPPYLVDQGVSLYRTTVARWAQDWAAFVVSFDAANPSDVQISGNSGLTDQPEAAAMQGEEMAEQYEYIVGDRDDPPPTLEAVPIVVPIRAGR